MNAPATIAETTPQLPVEQRAAIALGSSAHESVLIELAQSAAGIVAITNPAGYQECHARRMALKRARVSIAQTGKSARDDATAFSKAVIAEEKRLIAIVEPEETRLQALQDAHDAAAEAAKKAREQAEADRLAAIQARIDWIRMRPPELVGKSAADVLKMIDVVDALPITPELYGERVAEATDVRVAVSVKLGGLYVAAEEAEKQAAALKRDREAFEAEQRERTERNAREDAERKFAADWDDAVREDAQRATDAAIARARAAEDAARAAELAARDQAEAAERAEQKRRDDEAAAARKRERDALEARADPWAALTAIENCAMSSINGGIRFEHALTAIVERIGNARAARAALDKVTP